MYFTLSRNRNGTEHVALQNAHFVNVKIIYDNRCSDFIKVKLGSIFEDYTPDGNLATKIDKNRI